MCGFFLALAMVVNLLPGTVFAADNCETGGYTGESGNNLDLDLSSQQKDALELADRSNRDSGLVGFDDDWDLDEFDDTDMVSVIVEFVHQPAAVEQIVAAYAGNEITLDEAKALAENDQDEFSDELYEMLSVKPRGKNVSDTYEITATYTDALNGVAITLPASKVDELVELDTVWAVYPDSVVELDPGNPGVTLTHDSALSRQIGLSDSRSYLGIDELHEQGLTGEGVVVGIIDSGVDYNHPDLQDAFSDTYPGIDGLPVNERLKSYNNKFYGRNFVSDSSLPTRSTSNPMETTYADWLGSGKSELHSNGNTCYTYHGTHISGIIAARGINEPVSALGIAPDVTLLAYRVLGAYGNGLTTAIVAAIDCVYKDGCDVVNMSLGTASNNPSYVTSVAVNNVILAHDIIFTISSGNNGPRPGTVGSPGTSPLAITVGNGTVNSSDLVATMSSGGTDEGLRLVANGYGDINESGGADSWSFDNFNPSNTELILIGAYGANTSFQIGDTAVGVGTRAQFVATGRDNIQGKIAVVYRGQSFSVTSRLAGEYGAAAVIVVTNETSANPSFVGVAPNYVPVLLTDTKLAAIRVIKNALDHGSCKLTFSDMSVVATAGGGLHHTSSRGPVGITSDIKPDIVAPGTSVVSTVPFYETTLENKSDHTEPEAYDYAYGTQTGTSMAAPHIAGIAALIRQYSDDRDLSWSALEIKAKMVNTANRMPGYSVHEVGSGYVNPAAAINSGAYVTVDYSNVLTDNSSASGEVPSFTFTSVEADGSQLHTDTQSAQIYNSEKTAKTFSLSYEPNYVGFQDSDEDFVATEEMWDTAGIEVKFSSPSVTVGGYDMSSFETTVIVPAGISDAGLSSCYEGYIIFENTSDPSEVYDLPFSAHIKYTGQSAKYTLSFDSNGGSSIDPITEIAGTTIALNHTPTRTGYNFSGWYSDVNLTNRVYSVALSRNMTVYAGWTPKIFTISFDTNGGSPIGPVTGEFATAVELTQTPTRANYTFVGWYSDEALTVRIYSVTLSQDTTVYAKWALNSVPTHTLSFDTNGGSPVAPVPAEEGTAITLTQVSSKEGHSFMGWYKDAGLTQKVTSISLTKDTTVYAKWSVLSYSLTFETSGGSTVTPVTAPSGTRITLTQAPTREGYTFEGWYRDSGLREKVTSVTLTGNTIVYAKWTVLTYTLTFEAGGGSGVGAITAEYGTRISLSPPPARDGYTFGGWYRDANLEYMLSAVVLTEDTTVYARWIPEAATTHTLTFETNGGEPISAVIAEPGTIVNLTQVPIRKGHLFEGWYTDAKLSDAVTSVTLARDITVYAKWKEITAELDKQFRGAYVNGYREGTVRPESPITREEVAAIFYRLMTEESRECFEGTENDFNDVDGSRWSNIAISTLVNAGVLNGYGDGTFKPQNPIIRAELVKVAESFEKALTGNLPNPFSDISGHWAAPHIISAASRGWIEGYGGNQFRPGNNITRAETMKIVNVVLGRTENHIDSIKDMISWSDNADNTVWYYKHVQLATNSF